MSACSGSRLRGARSRAASTSGSSALGSCRPTARTTRGLSPASRPNWCREASASNPPIWCTLSPSASAWTPSAATAWPASNSAHGRERPVPSTVCAATRMSALAAWAQLRLPGARTPSNRVNVPSPRRPNQEPPRLAVVRRRRPAGGLQQGLHRALVERVSGIQSAGAPPLCEQRVDRYRGLSDLLRAHDQPVLPSDAAEQQLEGRGSTERPLAGVDRGSRRATGDQVGQLDCRPLDPLVESAADAVAAGPVLGGGEHRRSAPPWRAGR